VIVQEFLTLDGVMQGPGGADEDRSGGFDLGGWQLGYKPDQPDEVGRDYIMAGLEAASGLLLGRVTYAIFADYWPKNREGRVGEVMNGFDNYVVSRTLTEPLSWAGTHLIKEDAPSAIERLKKDDAGDMIVIGSGGLVQTLVENDLVDEFRLLIHPIVLGRGKRLFRDGLTPHNFRVADSVTTPTGIVLLTLKPE
jgi:dihydrofolate reductase